MIAAVKRNLLIDAAKGMGILLVVFGHCLQTYTPNFDDNILFRFIYSFHMPLFIFLSGCVAKYGDVRSITKNITRLVVPFVAWYLIGYGLQYWQNPVKPEFGEYILKLIKSPDYGLWFLWIMFMCHCWFYIMSQAQRFAGVFAAAAVFFVLYYVPVNILGIYLLKLHFAFFVMGFLAIKYKDYLIRWKYQGMIAASILFFVFFPYWYRTNSDLYLNSFNWLPDPLHKKLHYTVSFYRYAVSTMGITVIISLVYFMIKFRPIEWVLTRIGKYTLDIYVSHQLMIGYTVGNSVVLKILTGFVNSLILSLSLGAVLRKVPVLRTVLYGITENKAKAQPVVSGQ